MTTAPIKDVDEFLQGIPTDDRLAAFTAGIEDLEVAPPGPPASGSEAQRDDFKLLDEPAAEDEQNASPSAFAIEHLPPAIRAFAEETARVQSVPVELPAVCCLAVASSAIGSRLRVRSINGKTTPANIMALIGADSGSGKSEVHRVCMSPFAECQQREKEAWQRDVLPGARAEVRMLNAEIKKRVDDLRSSSKDREAIKREIASMEAKLAAFGEQMKEPFYHASDFTTPQLIRLLSLMDGQLFATSSDAKNFVDMVLGRYNEGGTDEEVYLKAFSLEAIDRHRVGDGSAETTEACITGLWLTQPDKLQRLLAKRELSEGGLLPRLLLLEIACPPLRVSMEEKGISAATTKAYHRLIGDLFQNFRLNQNVRLIDADEDARQALVNYHNAVADRREGELHDISGFAARWGEYAWRLALVVHAARLGGEAADSPLTLADAQAGIALAAWFAGQQLHLLGNSRRQARDEVYKRVLALFQASKPEIVTRDVYRAGITPRGRPDMAAALLEEMVAASLLAFVDRPTARKGHEQRAYRQRK